MSTTNYAELIPSLRPSTDRLGVIASVLCAIHCAAAPFLLLAAPAFGRIWAHPASHWAMALLVIPVAMVMALRGFRRHRRKWVIGCALVGILFVTAGAFMPYLEFGKNHSNGISITLPEESAIAADECADSCCPSAANVSGQKVMHIPPAAILTTLGGIALIITHAGNLCACRSCCSRP